MPSKKEKSIEKVIVGSKLTTGETVSEVQAIQFETQEQMDSFIAQLQAANEGSTDPIILPDGTTLRPLAPYEKWFWEQMARINILLMLLFAGMR